MHPPPFLASFCSCLCLSQTCRHMHFLPLLNSCQYAVQVQDKGRMKKTLWACLSLLSVGSCQGCNIMLLLTVLKMSSGCSLQDSSAERSSVGPTGINAARGSAACIPCSFIKLNKIPPATKLHAGCNTCFYTSSPGFFSVCEEKRWKERQNLRFQRWPVLN